jgi:O-acetyl-ADP-ribose deacetylase (regulator of RNase III)
LEIPATPQTQPSSAPAARLDQQGRVVIGNTILSVSGEDITKLRVDAIVNAANPSLLGGGGIDGAIHKAAGPDLRKHCERLINDDGVRCKVGEAKITKGYNLPARFVIHTVGPRISGNHPTPADAANLKKCYKSSLTLCDRCSNSGQPIEQVAFPCISCGSYKFPHDEARKIAIEAVREYINDTPKTNIKGVIFCVPNDEHNKREYENSLRALVTGQHRIGAPMPARPSVPLPSTPPQRLNQGGRVPQPHRLGAPTYTHQPPSQSAERRHVPTSPAITPGGLTHQQSANLNDALSALTLKGINAILGGKAPLPKILEDAHFHAIRNNYTKRTPKYEDFFFISMEKGGKPKKWVNMTVNDMIHVVKDRSQLGACNCTELLTKLENLEKAGRGNEVIRERTHYEDIKRCFCEIVNFRPGHHHTVHGPKHATRTLINVLLLAKLLYEKGVKILPEQILAGAIAAIFHDSGRQGDDKDVYEKNSAYYAGQHCWATPELKQYAHIVFSAIINKDAKGTDKQSLAKTLVQVADCLEITRCIGGTRNFNPGNLDLVKMGLITQQQGQRLAEVTWRLVHKTGVEDSDSDYRNNYKDDAYIRNMFNRFLGSARNLRVISDVSRLNT